MDFINYISNSSDFQKITKMNAKKYCRKSICFFIDKSDEKRNQQKVQSILNQILLKNETIRISILENN
jgi:hypothetical protein